MARFWRAARLVSFVGGTLSVALTACSGAGSRPNPNSLRDTTGLTFPWQCTESGCQLGADSPRAFATCDQPVGYTYLLERLFYLCASSVSELDGEVISGWGSDDCRAAACSTDDDCPIFEGFTYRCDRGLCVDTDISPAHEDTTYLIALCQSTIARPTDCNAIDPMATALISANCDAAQVSCTVPSSCQTP